MDFLQDLLKERTTLGHTHVVWTARNYPQAQHITGVKSQRDLAELLETPQKKAGTYEDDCANRHLACNQCRARQAPSTRRLTGSLFQCIVQVSASNLENRKSTKSNSCKQ